MKEGWICPKCGHVWSPDIWGCQDCNKASVGRVKTSASCKHHFIWDGSDGDGWTYSICGAHTTYIPLTCEGWDELERELS